MSDKVGPVDFGDSESAMLGGGRSHGGVVSETTASMIDAEVSRIMRDAGERAKKILTEHEKALHNMSKELTKIETIERKEFEDLLVLNGIKPKKIPDAVIAMPVVITPET